MFSVYHDQHPQAASVDGTVHIYPSTAGKGAIKNI